MRAKFAALQVVGAGLLVALWLSGCGPMLAKADRLYAAPVIGLAILIGLVCAWRGFWEATDWIADKLPVLGLIGTVAGVVLAIAGIKNGDLDAERVKIFSEIGNALVANLFGIVGYAWLALTERLCAE